MNPNSEPEPEPETETETETDAEPTLAPCRQLDETVDQEARLLQRLGGEVGSEKRADFLEKGIEPGLVTRGQQSGDLGRCVAEDLGDLRRARVEHLDRSVEPGRLREVPARPHTSRAGRPGW